jgi:antitoxin component YwqK of YwqJK toxin-antitoxin module
MKTFIITSILLLTHLFSSASTILKNQFYDNGCIKTQVIKVNDDLYQINKFYENGNISEVQYYNSDLNRVGIWVHYSQSGQKESEASFKNDKKDGFWKIYDNNNRLSMILEYKNGKRIHSYSWCEEKGLVAMSH